MYEQETIQLIKTGLAYMGTVDQDNRPRVRPMKPYLDRDGHIWLFSGHGAQKTLEIAANPRVELCISGPGGETLTLAGRLQDQTKPGDSVFRVQRDLLLADIPEARNYAKDNNLDTLLFYRLLLHEIRYARPDGEYTTCVNLPMTHDPDVELSLCQGGFCLMP